MQRISIQAQTRRGAVGRPKLPLPNLRDTQPREPSGENQNKACSGGWSGVVTFEKKLKDRPTEGEKYHQRHDAARRFARLPNGADCSWTARKRGKHKRRLNFHDRSTDAIQKHRERDNCFMTARNARQGRGRLKNGDDGVSAKAKAIFG